MTRIFPKDTLLPPYPTRVLFLFIFIFSYMLSDVIARVMGEWLFCESAGEDNGFLGCPRTFEKRPLVDFTSPLTYGTPLNIL